MTFFMNKMNNQGCIVLIIKQVYMLLDFVGEGFPLTWLCFCYSVWRNFVVLPPLDR